MTEIQWLKTVLIVNQFMMLAMIVWTHWISKTNLDLHDRVSAIIKELLILIDLKENKKHDGQS